MRIYTRIVRDMSTWEVLESDSYEYSGPLAQCKGDSTAQAAEQQQMNFDSQLMSIFQQQFSKQSAVMSYLQGKMQPMIDNPTGYSPEALAAMRTSATDTIANQYQNAQRGLQAKEFTQGGRDLPSGVNDQLDASLFNAEATDQANSQNDITLQNENLKQQNYWNALNVLSGVGAQFNPLGYAGAATSGGNTVANLSNAVTNSQQSGLMGLLGSAIGGAGSVFAGAGTKALFGCWVASTIYGGWLAPNTIMVRNYIFEDFASTWYGHPVAWLYSRTGRWISQKPALVSMLKPLFNLALSKAQEKYAGQN